MAFQQHDIDLERLRCDALRATGLLDDAPAELGAACEHARQRFGVPVALVTLVTEDRVRTAAARGLRPGIQPRRGSFCDLAVRRDEVLVISDASADDRFADRPPLALRRGFRFYAGAPLCHVRGLRLGTLCLLDRRPRDLSPRDSAELEAMADALVALVLERQFDRLPATIA